MTITTDHTKQNKKMSFKLGVDFISAKPAKKIYPKHVLEREKCFDDHTHELLIAKILITIELLVKSVPSTDELSNGSTEQKNFLKNFPKRFLIRLLTNKKKQFHRTQK